MYGSAPKKLEYQIADSVEVGGAMLPDVRLGAESVRLRRIASCHI